MALFEKLYAERSEEKKYAKLDRLKKVNLGLQKPEVRRALVTLITTES